MFQDGLKGVSRKFEGCSIEVLIPKNFEGCFKDMSKVFQGSFKGASIKF